MQYSVVLIYRTLVNVCVFQAKDLPAKDLSGTSDPYVKLFLLPDKKHKLETKIKRRTLHPKWHETLYFEGKYSKIICIARELVYHCKGSAGLNFFTSTVLTTSQYYVNYNVNVYLENW